MSDRRREWTTVIVAGLTAMLVLGIGRALFLNTAVPPAAAPTSGEPTAPTTTRPAIAEPVVAVVADRVEPNGGNQTTMATEPGTVEDFSTAFGAEAHPLTVGEWTLAFRDDFGGNALDRDAWTTCHWWDDGGCTIASNEELEWYRPDNVTVLDGAVRLEARREAAVAPDGQTFAYTSGMISTGRNGQRWEDDPRFAFTGGYVEMRARVPAGAGLWPSFWLLPEDHRSRPQIDVMTVLGDNPTVVRPHVNYINELGNRRTDGIHHKSPDLSEDWHTYGLLWEGHRLAWYFDGRKIWSTTDPQAVPDEPMYLIASLAVGGDYAGDPGPSTRFPATFHIDYIRVWQPAP